MKALISAIRAHWEGNAALFSVLTGGLHLGQEPAEKTQPYCVITVEETPWWTFDTNFESYIIPFFLYSRDQSPSVILDIHEKLKAAFDEARLTVDGYHVIRFWRSGGGRLQRVETVWVLPLEYSCELEQNG